MMGLRYATLSDWAKVKERLHYLERLKPSQGILELYSLYLSGTYYQGTANLALALGVFEDPRFSLGLAKSEGASERQLEFQLSILAALNRLWILQEPSHRDDRKTAELAEQLKTQCEQNPDPEIKTAYNVAMAAIQKTPPLSINQIKRHIQSSLNGAQNTSNTHFTSIALNTMRCRLFENVVGEQALKSAKAGAAQAKRVGNLLWMSVADGMLAQSYEVQGAMVEARTARESGIRLANEAFTKTQV
jgi:hypothetical protein